MSTRRVPRLLAVALFMVLTAACGVDDVPEKMPKNVDTQNVAAPTESLTLANPRASTGVPASGGPPAPYNYGPTVLQEDQRYRAWWCSQLPGIGPAGDDIVYAESAELDGGFRASGGPAVPVFAGRPNAFDGMHTCDPSVLRVHGRYYMYYTGAAADHAHGNAIGVASSPDGVAWRREAAGRPIVTASGEVRRHNVYGAGQPSVLYLDGWFYLMFTDTTAAAAGWNGAGQFILRARNPEFSDRVQALTASGFQPAGVTDSAQKRSVVDAFSADWMWVDALGAFAIAHQTEGGTTITFWNRSFTHQPYSPLVVPGPWREGPGLVRAADGHAPRSASDPCSIVPVDVLRATTSNPAPTKLKHFGLDVVGLHSCDKTARAKSLVDGFGVPSPERTVDIVRDGAKLRVERRSVAEKLARGILDDPVPALNNIPVVGRISSGATAWLSPNGEIGLIDDKGHLWTVSSDVAQANDSELADVSQRQWDSRAHIADLR